MAADQDVELMLRFKEGDRTAFRQLFDKHKKGVISHCYRFCMDTAVAEDLAQETFLRVYQSAARYKPKARFRTWLYKIATNVCLNEIRKFQRRSIFFPQEEHLSRLEVSADDPQPDEQLEHAQHQNMVLGALGQLPEDQRAALMLRVAEEFSYREIGYQIGRNENHVKVLIHRGRKKLKKILADYFGDKS
jgi:RNA polymerase sigma-70 factor (ECF subfamily)